MSEKNTRSAYYNAYIFKGCMIVETDHVPRFPDKSKLNSNHTKFEHKDCHGFTFFIDKEMTDSMTDSMIINKNIKYGINLKTNDGTQIFIGYHKMETVTAIMEWYNNYEESRLEQEFIEKYGGTPQEIEAQLKKFAKDISRAHQIKYSH